MKSRLPFLAASAWILITQSPVSPAAHAEVALDLLSTYDTGLGEGASEIVAFDPDSQRIFTVNATAATVDIIDLTNPRNKGNDDYAYINGTLHGNPIAAAASLATLAILSEPGFHQRLNERAERFYGDMQAVLDRHSVPAIVTGRASFWQFLFAERAPRNQLDVLASQLPRSQALDLELLRRGVYVLPNVRRFVSAVHTDEDLAFTLAALDEACMDINRSMTNG